MTGSPGRIVVVCQGRPHPSEGASVVLYWWYLQGLVRAGWQVDLLVIVSDGRVSTDEPWFSALSSQGSIRLHECQCANPIHHGLSGIRIDAGLQATLQEAIVGLRPDLVLCFDWIAAAACSTAQVPRVVWLGDLQFQTLLYHTRYALREGSRRYDRLLLLPYRTGQLRRLYRRILADAALTIVSSHSSIQTLAPLGIAAEYLPYPWPALPPSPVGRAPDLQRPAFLFSGTLGALGSRSAFHWMLAALHAPLVQRLGSGGFRLLITGRGDLPGWAASAIARHPELEFLGFVDDLAGLMAHCTGFIAPIDVPVGNRSRILTAMAAGLPIVAHPNTAVGNPLLVDGTTCHLAADPQDFAARMHLLARDPAAAAALADRARAAYQAHHAPDAANALLVGRLQTLLDSRATHSEG